MPTLVCCNDDVALLTQTLRDVDPLPWLIGAHPVYGLAMEYNDVIAARFAPSADGAVAKPTVQASSARQLRDAVEPIAMHSVWCRGTNERLAKFGHNFMTAYVCSRAALLGDPTPGVIASSFAVFEPDMLTGVYAAGKELCERSALLQARDEATIASLSGVLAGEDVCGVADVLRRGVEAASGTGRPLFSGLRDQPWPDSDIGQLWRAAELFREHRGDSHVAACVAAGLDPIEMNVMTELFVGMKLGTYSATRGWDEAALQGGAQRLRDRGLIDGDGLSDAGGSFRSGIEHHTDVAQQSIIAAIGGDLGAVVEATTAWSQRCVDVQAFPPNVFKRAAG